MADSLSGQAQGRFKQSSASPVAFHDPRTFVKHDFEEKSVDLGEVVMNCAETGPTVNPPLLLMLLTHHMRFVNPENGNLLGAMSDLQATKAREMMASTGSRSSTSRSTTRRMRCTSPIRSGSRMSSPGGRRNWRNA